MRRLSLLAVGLVALGVCGCAYKGGGTEPGPVSVYRQTYKIVPNVPLDTDVSTPADEVAVLSVVTQHSPDLLWRVILNPNSSGRFQFVGGRVRFRLNAGSLVAVGWWPWVVTGHAEGGVETLTFDDRSEFYVGLQAAHTDFVHMDGKRVKVYDDTKANSRTIPFGPHKRARVADDGTIVVSTPSMAEMTALLNLINYYPTLQEVNAP